MEDHKKSFLKGLGLGIGCSLLLAALCLGAVFFGKYLARTLRGDESRPAEEKSTAAQKKDTSGESRTESGSPESQSETAPWDQSEAAARFEEVMELMNEYFVLDCDPAEMLNAALKAYVAASGDPYSAYLSAEEFAEMMESSDGSYCGIGVMVSQNIETLETLVIQVFTGSSAREQGMLAGDIIVSVNGEDVRKMDVDTLVTRIRGEEGTTVEVGIYRPAEQKNYSFTVERRIVEVDTVAYKMLTDTVGYLQLTEFDTVSVGQVRKALTDMKSRGMTSLIFDIRNNPGGLLSSVLDIVDLLLPKGVKTFSMISKDGQEYVYYSQNEPLFSGSMAVLMNGSSASAAEVFAGNMQDHKRAVLMGEKSFGKGIVQGFFNLSDGSALKLTTEYYFTPNGRCIHKLGIEPDIAGADDVSTPETDELLQQALTYLKEKP